MIKSVTKRIAAVAVSILLTATAVFAFPQKTSAASVQETDSQIVSILSYEMKKAGAQSVQELINGKIASGAGTTSEWYVLALRQYEKGYDFSAYVSSLKKYVSENQTGNASTRLRYALAFASIGTNYEYITSTLGNSIEGLGIMSRIFGLHFINNGYTCDVSQSEAVNQLLSYRLPDGGFCISGGTADVDVTAMAVQALAKHYSDQSVKAVIDEALTLLSSRQLPDGGFSSYGVENPESSAQVIVALSALGIDCTADARFIKNGKTPLDSMLSFKLADGSFSHVAGGEANNNATVQALYSLVALQRFEKGLSPLYIFAKKAVPAPTTTAAPQTAAPAPVYGKPAYATTAATSAHATSAAETTTRESNRRVTTARSERTTQAKTQRVTSAPTQAASSAANAATFAQTTHSALEQLSTLPSTVSYETASSSETVKAETDTDIQTITDALPDDNSFNYKTVVYAVIVLACAAAIIVLLITGKKNPKDFIAVILVAAVLCCANAFTDISSKDKFYSAETSITGNDISVTLSISCGLIAGKSDAQYIPADGVILPETELTLPEGATVYDALILAARQYEIQVDNSSASADSSAYISGINYIYEFDFGDLSGWCYTVNGALPSVGCGGYKLEENDKIEWVYSLDLGEDIT